MAVTFGTPVVSTVSTSAQTSFTLTMSTVTSGQPIFLFFYDNGSTTGLSSITDTFSASYTWTLISHAGNGIGASLYIGTNGGGTSGVITVNCPSERSGGIAVPCLGASTASGLIALDGFSSATGTSNTPTGPSLTPSVSGEGAIYAVASTNGYSASPSGYTITQLTYNATYVAGTATQASPTSGTALTPGWTLGASHTWVTIGAIARVTGSPAGVGGSMLSVML